MSQYYVPIKVTTIYTRLIEANSADDAMTEADNLIERAQSINHLALLGDASEPVIDVIDVYLVRSRIGS